MQRNVQLQRKKMCEAREHYNNRQEVYIHPLSSQTVVTGRRAI